MLVLLALVLLVLLLALVMKKTNHLFFLLVYLTIHPFYSI
jgi:hypothetical protein